MEKHLEFKKELKALLQKYNADIWLDLDGDTHGVDAYLVIDVDNKEVLRRRNSIDHTEINTD